MLLLQFFFAKHHFHRWLRMWQFAAICELSYFYFTLLFYDARVKSLKPRCACTGVVLWLYGPPDMSIKVERKLHDMRILDRIVEVRSTEQSVRHLLTLTSFYQQ